MWCALTISVVLACLTNPGAIQKQKALLSDALESFQRLPLQKQEAEAVKTVCVAADQYFTASDEITRKAQKDKKFIPQQTLLDTAVTMDLLLLHHRLTLNYLAENINAKNEEALGELDKKYRFRVQKQKTGQWRVVER